MLLLCDLISNTLTADVLISRYFVARAAAKRGNGRHIRVDDGNHASLAMLRLRAIQIDGIRVIDGDNE